MLCAEPHVEAGSSRNNLAPGSPHMLLALGEEHVGGPLLASLISQKEGLSILDSGPGTQWLEGVGISYPKPAETSYHCLIVLPGQILTWRTSVIITQVVDQVVF